MSTSPKHPASFVDIALLWELEDGRKTRLETAQAFARDIGQDWPRVYKWMERNFVPIDYWAAIIAAVKRRFGIVLTLDQMHAMGVAALRARQSRKEDAA
jgi:hypothetical protein